MPSAAVSLATGGLGLPLALAGLGVSSSTTIEAAAKKGMKKAQGKVGLKRRNYATQLWHLAPDHKPTMEFMEQMGMIPANAKDFFDIQNKNRAVDYIMRKLRS